MIYAVQLRQEGRPTAVAHRPIIRFQLQTQTSQQTGNTTQSHLPLWQRQNKLKNGFKVYRGRFKGTSPVFKCSFFFYSHHHSVNSWSLKHYTSSKNTNSRSTNANTVTLGFACSPHVCVGSLHVLQLPLTCKRHGWVQTAHKCTCEGDGPS